MVLAGTAGATAIRCDQVTRVATGSERLGGIEIEIGEQHGVVSNVRADDEQRVTVRRCRRGRLGADAGAAAGAVLDDDILADPGLQMLRDDASQRVDRPARGERHDQLDGLRRIVLRGDGICSKGQTQNRSS